MTLSLRAIAKVLLIIFITLFLLVLLVSTILTLFIVTERGSAYVGKTLLDRVNQSPDSSIAVGTITGNLFQGLNLNQVRFANSSMIVTSAEVATRWNPYSIFSGRFVLSQISLEELAIQMLESSGEESGSPTAMIDEFDFQPLPIDISIEQLDIDGAKLTMAQTEYDVQRISAALRLDQSNVQISDLTVAASGVSIEADVGAALEPGLPLQATINWNYQGNLFDLYSAASGILSIEGSLNSMNVSHQLQTPLQIETTGTVTNTLEPDALIVEVTSSASDLPLPFDALSTTEFTDVVLRSVIDGGNISLELDTNVLADSIPPLRASIAGSLEGQGLNLESFELDFTDAAISGEADLSWADGIVGRATYALIAQEPLNTLNIEAPLTLTDLSGNGEILFSIVENDTRIEIQIDGLEGLLNSYDLIGGASISVINDAIQINQLQLASGNNQLRVDGNYDDELEINWQVLVPDLDQVITDYAGTISANGAVRGTLESPQVRSEFSVQSLVAGTVSVESVNGTVNGAFDDYHLNIDLINARLGDESTGQRIETGNLTLDGSLADQIITAEVESTDIQLEIALRGGVEDISSRQWAGELTSGRIDSPLGQWQTVAGSALTISQQVLNLQSSCWQQSATEVCVNLDRVSASDFRLGVELANFPLAELNAQQVEGANQFISLENIPRLPEGITLDGFAGGDFSALLNSSGLVEAQFSVGASNFQLTLASESTDEDLDESEELALADQYYHWEAFALQGNYSDSGWQINGAANLDQQNIDNTDFQLEGRLETSVTIDQNNSLSGTVTAGFQDLGWVSALVPEVSAVSGNLQSTIGLSGSLQEPQFDGELKISEAAFTVNSLGVTFFDFETTLEAQSSGVARLLGSVKSGEGSLEFDGNVTDLYSNGRLLTLTLTGDDFQFVNIPDLSLNVSPDISLTGSAESINIAGSLSIPLLNLTLEELPVSAIDVSRDVVIVSYPQDRPDLARSGTTGTATVFDIPVTANVTLNLGEQVKFNGFGLEAGVEGSLDIQQLANGTNLTYGELTIVDGSYRIYGQTLVLRQGKLLFFGAYDNPALDIRAVREANNVTAGVLMNGTLKNISSQLFSSPTLPENDIIAVLITGRPFSEVGSQDSDAMLGAIAQLGLKQSQSLSNQVRDKLGLDTLAVTNTGDINASMLTIGKYLTPEIFIRYGVGLFDSQSKVAVDYSITQRIKLQAETGEHQSVDITYTVER